MQIHREERGEALVATIMDDRLDAAGTKSFKSELSELVDAGHHHIVLDLSSVGFIDSSGLGAIVSGLKMLGNNGEIVICGTRPTVTSIFKLTRMDKVFRMTEDVDEAIACFSK